jgi:hypothetical protein
MNATTARGNGERNGIGKRFSRPGFFDFCMSRSVIGNGNAKAKFEQLCSTSGGFTREPKQSDCDGYHRPPNVLDYSILDFSTDDVSTLVM